MCFACRVVALRLGLPLVPVLPARLCPLPSALYAVLLGYKESPVAEERARLGARVGALCRAFLEQAAPNLRAMAGGAIDQVVPVPSTARPGFPPLARVEGLGDEVCVALPGAAWLPTAVQRASRAAAPRLGHMRPHARGFSIRGDAPSFAGRRVLVLDDLYVSGARAQSTAAVLRVGGASAVIIAVLGRVLRPDRVPAHRRYLARLASDGRVPTTDRVGQFSGA